MVWYVKVHYGCLVITGSIQHLPRAEATSSANYKGGPVVKVLYLEHQTQA